MSFDKSKEASILQILNQTIDFYLLGRLLSSVTHDINSPLTYIRGNAEIIPLYVEKTFDLLEDIDNTDSKREVLSILNSLKTLGGEMFQGTTLIADIVSDLTDSLFLSSASQLIKKSLSDIVDDVLIKLKFNYFRDIKFLKDFSQETSELKIFDQILKLAIFEIFLYFVKLVKFNQNIEERAIHLRSFNAGKYLLFSVECPYYLQYELFFDQRDDSSIRNVEKYNYYTANFNLIKSILDFYGAVYTFAKSPDQRVKLELFFPLHKINN